MLKLKTVIILSVTILLSGCLYPDDRRVENSIPPRSEIELVQSAVDDYQEKYEVLPIKNVEHDTEYLQYQVDFQKLIPNFLSERPSSSFEGGGHYQYVIVDEENDPKVKIADLRINEALRSLMLRIDALGDYVELGEQIGPNVYQLDLEYYNLNSNPTVTSPYTSQSLNVYYSGGNTFVVDYRQDIGKIIDENNLTFETGDDLREVLYEYTPVVPIHSPEITIDENGDVVFMTSQHKLENQ